LAEEETRKIEEAKKTISQSGKALGRNPAANLVSSYSGTGTGTVTSEFESLEEEKEEE